MKKVIIALCFLAAFVSGIALAQVSINWSKTDTATKFRIDEIKFVPYLKACSSQYTFLNAKDEAVASKSIKLDCKAVPGIANAVKYVTAQIGLAEGKVIPDLPDVTK